MDETGNNQLGDLLSGLMSNPDAMNMISGLMKSMSAPQAEGSLGGTAAAPTSAEPEVSTPQVNDTPLREETASQPAGAFGGISPDMLKMLPNIMSMLGPMINQNKSDSSDSPRKDTSQKDDAVQTSGVPSGGHPHHNHRTAEQRNRLLYALKPYLSHSRREAVEQIAKITQITDILGETGILTSFRGETPLRGGTHDEKNSEPDKYPSEGNNPFEGNDLGMIHKT